MLTANGRQRTGERASSLIVFLIFIFGNGLLIVFQKLEKLMLPVCADGTVTEFPGHREERGLESDFQSASPARI